MPRSASNGDTPQRADRSKPATLKGYRQLRRPQGSGPAKKAGIWGGGAPGNASSKKTARTANKKLPCGRGGRRRTLNTTPIVSRFQLFYRIFHAQGSHPTATAEQRFKALYQQRTETRVQS